MQDPQRASNLDVSAKSWESKTSIRRFGKTRDCKTLAHSIANDLNNLVAVIIGCSQLLLEAGLAKSAEHRLHQILDAGYRTARLSDRILTFAKTQSGETAQLDLNDVILHATNMARHKLGKHFEVTTELAEELWNIDADMDHIEHVLLGFCLSAREASPKGGAVRVESLNVTIPEETAPRVNCPLEPGQYVRILVRSFSNSAEGDSPAEIFELFFPASAASDL